MDENNLEANGFEIPEIKMNDSSLTEPLGEENTPSHDLEPKVPSERRKKMKKILLGVAGVLVLIVVALVLLIGIPGFAIYGKAKVLKADADGVKAAVAKQNINDIKSSLSKLDGDLGSFQGSYKLLVWTKVVPVFGNYYRDGEAAIQGGIYGIDAAQIAIDTAAPYADIIGFTGDASKKAQSGEESANDRIQFLVSTIKDVLPKVDQIAEKAKLASAEFNKIDANRYPESIGGKKVREPLRQGLALVNEATQLVSESKPLLQEAPYLMGIDSPRTYLVIFQNDKELRPTGGFITGYSVMTVSKGKVSAVSSNDIYNLDKAYKPTIPAPDPIIKYLKGPYLLNRNLRLRDMNFDSDFKVAMDTFVKEAQKAGIGKIDGIIAVDTQTLVNVLAVIGNVGVPGYGNFNTTITPECNCPKVIFELESFADVEGSVVWDQNDPTKIIFAPANYYNRKAIVGPLMNSVLRNAMGQPKEKIPALFQAAWDSLTQKHILFYMLDPKAQAGVESFNIAGRVKEYSGDYLLVSDANLGGRKSNLYVTNEIVQDVSIGRDGSVTKTVTITYKNSQGYDGWLNSLLPSWVRIYVPKGSTLISVDGLDAKVDPYEDLGKTVFAGAYTLRPQGVQKITLKYKLPFNVKGEYKVLVQKQPGIDSITSTVNVGRQTQDLILKTDQEFKFKI